MKPYRLRNHPSMQHPRHRPFPGVLVRETPAQTLIMPHQNPAFTGLHTWAGSKTCQGHQRTALGSRSSTVSSLGNWRSQWGTARGCSVLPQLTPLLSGWRCVLWGVQYILTHDPLSFWGLILTTLTVCYGSGEWCSSTCVTVDLGTVAKLFSAVR